MPKRPERENIMLCYPTEEGRIRRLGSHCFTQPKLNGERCRVEWFHGKPVLISSYGNEFKYLNHINNEILEISRQTGQLPLDGELYKHGWSRERIHSACSRKVNQNPDSPQLELHIFDHQESSHPQWKRLATLLSINKKGLFSQSLQMVETHLTETINWEEHALHYIDEGYEGVILRQVDSTYTMKRSVNILKYKPTEEDEYFIIGYNEGTGWAEGMLGSFIVKGDDGTIFSVGSGKTLTKSNRKKYWAIRDELIGRMLIVKHEKMKTKGGVPIGAVAARVKGINI